MKFIELHHAEDHERVLINLAEVVCIERSALTASTILMMAHGKEDRIVVKEDYDEVRRIVTYVMGRGEQ